MEKRDFRLKLNEAIVLEEELTNALIGGIESLLQSQTEGAVSGKTKRLLEILGEIKADTEEHLNKVKEMMKE